MTHSSSTTKPIEISKKIIGVSVLNKESSAVSTIEKEAKIIELI
jgi:hypothetical protein